MNTEDMEKELLRLRAEVDKNRAETDKLVAVGGTNTKWMVGLGTLVLAALGFTNFYTVPRETKAEAKAEVAKQMPPAVLDEIARTVEVLRSGKIEAERILGGLKGSYFTQGGFAVVGKSNNRATYANVKFPKAFQTAPIVLVVARGENNQDTFAVSTRNVTKDGFTVNVARADQQLDWGQTLRVDWIAYDK